MNKKILPKHSLLVFVIIVGITAITLMIIDRLMPQYALQEADDKFLHSNRNHLYEKNIKEYRLVNDYIHNVSISKKIKKEY